MVKKFTAGYFMQMTEIFPFIEKENFIHKGIVEDDNVITGIGMFFREFAATVLRRLGYDIGHNFMRKQSDDYAQDELTFYWSDEDYKEFLEELKGYNDKEDKTNNKLKFAELNIRNMRNFDIEKEMYRLAVELIEKRYPVGWGGAGVIHTAKGHYFTSVSLDSANASAVLCIETGAMIEAHKFNEKVTHCMCLVREDENAPYQVLSPCGICQERLRFGVEMYK